MKYHTQKPPIDELFARKLGDASLPPSAEGFRQLQARMGQAELRQHSNSFWHRPGAHRYMSAAACLLLLVSFGWLYSSSTKTTELTGRPKAFTKSGSAQLADNGLIRRADKVNLTNPAMAARATPKANGRLRALNQVDRVSKSMRFAVRAIQPKGNERELLTPSGTGAAWAALNADPSHSPTASSAVTAPNPVSPEAGAGVTAAVKPAMQRTLVVTIQEPEALIAAQPSITATNTDVADYAPQSRNRAANQTKLGGLWQQVKRVKQVEVFARRDTNPDERGLLGRAYEGVKHSLEKDKLVKQ